MEREEAERAELRKMILGQSEKKPQINNQNDQQQSSNQGNIIDFFVQLSVGNKKKTLSYKVIETEELKNL